MKNSLARLVLLLSTVCLLTSAWGDCPNGLPTSKFGYWVKVGAGAGVGGDGPHPMKEETCWVAGRGATMQDHAESHNQWTDFASEYSYTVAPTGISASVRINGQQSSRLYGGGNAYANLWLRWFDTLTFHSNQLPQANRSDNIRLNSEQWDLLMAKSEISFTVKLLQNPPQCAGKSGKFNYSTGVTAAFKSVTGGGAMGPAGTPPRDATAETQFLRAETCGIPPQEVKSYIPNGYDLAIEVTVSELTSGFLTSTTSPPKGDLQVELSGERLCIVRPAKPSDLTITSASGASYWCP